jgi:catechol 2,3-dioxygenase-like lactoylglutathione lyase family enzyme
MSRPVKWQGGSCLMADFKVLATNHTSFTVSDLDRSIAFFRDCLGFELLSKAPRDPGTVERITGVADADIMVAYVQGPGHRLELIEYLAPADRGRLVPRPCRGGEVRRPSPQSAPGDRPRPERRGQGGLPARPGRRHHRVHPGARAPARARLTAAESDRRERETPGGQAGASGWRTRSGRSGAPGASGTASWRFGLIPRRRPYPTAIPRRPGRMPLLHGFRIKC